VGPSGLHLEGHNAKSHVKSFSQSSRIKGPVACHCSVVFDSRNLNKRAAPIAVNLPSIVTDSPNFPPGLTNVAPISVETPVIHCPLVAMTRDPIVSVNDRMTPPCKIFKFTRSTRHMPGCGVVGECQISNESGSGSVNPLTLPLFT
jgi:hypothetical protein